jgi:septum site-determining protein MinD
MPMSDEVCALVGGVGGAGTTRLALEFGATLARDGRSVLIVDAAYATQGLATVVPGRIDTDLTAAIVEDRPLRAATYDLGLALGPAVEETDDGDGTDATSPPAREPDREDGRVAVAPARAPFERFSRAKTSECGRRLAERLAAAAREYDHVLVDVPPVAANQAVAAVTAADRVVVVVPDSQRGVDALGRMRDRLADVDAAVDAAVANLVGASPQVEAADATVPTAEEEQLAEAPVAVGPTEFAAAVGAATETALAVDLGLAEPESSSLTDYLTG